MRPKSLLIQYDPLDFRWFPLFSAENVYPGGDAATERDGRGPLYPVVWNREQLLGAGVKCL